MKNFQIKKFCITLIWLFLDFLGLSQELSLESYQLLLAATFLTGSLDKSQNSAMFRALNHV